MMAHLHRQTPGQRQRQNLRFFLRLKVLEWSQEEVSQQLRRADGGLGDDRPGTSARLPVPTIRRAQLLHELFLDLPTAEPGSKQILEILVGNLDDRGFLSEDPRELFKSESFPPDQIGRLLNFLKNVDGRGIGSKNMADFLYFQLARRPEVWAKAAAKALLTSRQKFPNLQKILRHLDRSLTKENFSHFLNNLQRRELLLTPIDLQPDGIDALRQPDLMVQLENGELSVQPAPIGNLEAVQNGLLRWALLERQKTLLLVANEIFSHQIAFLHGGLQDLIPLSQKTLAASLALTPPTVCRAINHKYVKTPFGIHPLRIFASDERRCASLKIKQSLTEIFSENLRASRHTDGELSLILLNRFGLKVSPRTVCKYRNQLFRF